jgi:uncharacterized short protein YbdD (DUF466 family)
MDKLNAFFRIFLAIARRLVEDDAYDRYLAHRCCTEPPLSRQEFYRRHFARKGQSIERCC